MLRRLSHEELTYWLILQAVDPVGEERADLRASISTAALHNTQVTRKKDAKKPKDFHAGEFLRKQHRKSMDERGLKQAWDGAKWKARWFGWISKHSNKDG